MAPAWAAPGVGRTLTPASGCPDVSETRPRIRAVDVVPGLEAVASTGTAAGAVDTGASMRMSTPLTSPPAGTSTTIAGTRRPANIHAACGVDHVSARRQAAEPEFAQLVGAGACNPGEDFAPTGLARHAARHQRQHRQRHGA